MTRGNSQKMARARKLLNRVTTYAMEYRGGKEQKIWTWSGLTNLPLAGDIESPAKALITQGGGMRTAWLA